MPAIKLEGLDSVKEMLAGMGPALENASAKAQNTMAYELMMAERAQMRMDVDRPTPFSVNSIFYKKYGATSLKTPSGDTFEVPNIKGAAVFVANRISGWLQTESDYLGVQIAGGMPPMKRSEKILQRRGYLRPDQMMVPANKSDLDQYGNLKGWQISEMLTNMGMGFVQPTQELQFVLVGSENKWEGIFRWYGGEFVPFIWFVPRKNYSPRYGWEGRRDDEIAQNFKVILDDAINAELAKL